MVGEEPTEEPRSGLSSSETPQDVAHEGARAVAAEPRASTEPEVETGGQWPSAEVIPLKTTAAIHEGEASEGAVAESEVEAEREPQQRSVEADGPPAVANQGGSRFMHEAINALLRRKA